jgi:hypothetical protein
MGFFEMAAVRSVKIEAMARQITEATMPKRSHAARMMIFRKKSVAFISFK